jgi:lipopolysaccharide transport system permease protein
VGSQSTRVKIDSARYRDLVITLAAKEIRVRYKQSVMGFLWAILMPLLIIAAGAMVRKAMVSVAGAESLSLVPVVVKSAPWAFFVSAIRFGTDSLVKNTNLVTKIYFPREVVPYSAVLAALFDFGIASVGVIVALAIAQAGVSIQLVWVPVVLLLLIVLTTGLAVLLSSANLFFRDVKYLVEVFLTFGILFTPVFFEARMFQTWASILLLNPVGALLEALNDVVALHQAPDPFWLTYAALWAVGTFVLSTVVFRASEPLFAEKI